MPPRAAPRRWRVARDHGELLVEPRVPPGALQLRRELLVDDAQVTDVRERVAQLEFGQRPARPVGEALRLVDAPARELRHQRLVADRFAEAAHHRGDLSVEEGVRHTAGERQQHFDILPRRVKDLEDRRTNQKVVQRREVDPARERIHGDRLALGRADLHQAQLGAISALAHELGIDRDEVRPAPFRAEGGELCALADKPGLAHGAPRG